MLENKTQKIRNTRNIKKINTYFFISAIVSLSVAFILIPEFARYLLRTDEDEVILRLTINAIWQRGLLGSLAGVAFSLYGIKKFDPTLRISMIRFFLITFMLLVAMYYILTRT